MQRKKSEFSQSAVEFALVLPLLLLVILGLMEMGRLVFIYTAVLNASREAARYGAASGLSETAPTLRQYEDCSGIQNAAIWVGFLANIKVSNITIGYDSGGNPDDAVKLSSPRKCPPIAGSINGGDRIVVKVEVPFAPIVPLVPLKPIMVTSTNARTIIGSVAIEGEIPAPTGTVHIDSLEPAAGPSNIGIPVKIHGSGFAATATYTFAGATCTYTSPTLMECNTSPHPAEKVPVTVKVGTDISNTVEFEYFDGPTVSDISPAAGPFNAPTHVVISGNNFIIGKTVVTFDGATCNVDSLTQISCDTTASPSSPHAQIGVPISIVTPGGTAPTSFEYVGLPTITSVTPLVALPDGFIPLTILGNNFKTLRSVTFGGVTTVACAVSPTIPDTQIGCTVPAYVIPNPNPVDIIVTTLGGSVSYSSFTYVTATPTATWLYSPTPSQTATITPTTTITITPTVTLTSTNRPTVTTTLTNRPTVTGTGTQIPCVSLSSFNPNSGTNTAAISMTNNTGADIQLTGSYFIWNDNNGSGNGNLNAIKIQPFGASSWDTISSGTNYSSPNTTTSWSGAAALRTIVTTQTKNLQFSFSRDAVASGYYLELTFSNGCKVRTGIGITATPTP